MERPINLFVPSELQKYLKFHCMLLTNINTEALVKAVEVMKDEEINAYFWSAI